MSGASRSTRGWSQSREPSFRALERAKRRPVARAWRMGVNRLPHAAAADHRVLGAQALEGNRLGEFGAELVAGGPFDHGVGALAAGKHQPDPRTDVEIAVGLGHEAAFGNIDDAGVDSALAEFAHLGIETDRVARCPASVARVSGIGDARLNHRKTHLHDRRYSGCPSKLMPMRPSLTQRTLALTWPWSSS